MTTFDLSFNWLDTAGSPDRFSKETMASLRIRADRLGFSRVMDRESKSLRDEVFVPLFQVAEWAVANWWFLWHEPDAESVSLRRDGFAERHDLRYAGNGFFLPGVMFASLGEHVRVTSEPWQPSHGRIRFTVRQASIVDRDSVESAFRSLIDSVLERLRAKRLDPGGLARDWEAINRIEPDEEEFCKACALLGLDPFGVSDSDACEIESAWEATPWSVRADAFGACEASSLGSISEWVTDGLRSLDRAASSSAWDALRNTMNPPEGRLPWERGFALARGTRNKMNVGEGRIEFSGDWFIDTVERAAPDQRIDALLSGRGPSCLVAPRRDTGRRFLMARAVGEYLAGRSVEPSLLTRLSTEKQAQSRSFAAEFLAPAASIRGLLGSRRYIDVDEMDRLADHFGVSSWLIRHQVENQLCDVMVDDGLGGAW